MMTNRNEAPQVLICTVCEREKKNLPLHIVTG